ncbi:hypothetical protein Cgig2_018335 [Carnegiea gigantea]|uniref:Uncharacterized protein n=1 Tax=Carnegiea gigantea TaxID=171969 RepID=A0A9Q1KZL0_9CARY|nr:hypothetical protein Cgig2_018335 [Carnegiea gigantea]
MAGKTTAQTGVLSKIAKAKPSKGILTDNSPIIQDCKEITIRQGDSSKIQTGAQACYSHYKTSTAKIFTRAGVSVASALDGWREILPVLHLVQASDKKDETSSFGSTTATEREWNSSLFNGLRGQNANSDSRERIASPTVKAIYRTKEATTQISQHRDKRLLKHKNREDAAQKFSSESLDHPHSAITSYKPLTR